MAQANREPGPPLTLSRRRALVVGVAALAAGCSADPRIGRGSAAPTTTGRPRSTSTASAPPRPSPTATATPTPTFAGAPDGVALERRLAATAAGIGSRWRKDLDDRRTLLAEIRDAHLAHATALLGPDPTSRPQAGEPSASERKPKGDELDDALDDLAEAERRAAEEHRQRALNSSGFSALLWGSMAVAATGFAAAATTITDDEDAEPRFAKPPGRHTLPARSDTEAAQDLIRQLHAVVYGYQLAIGQLDSGRDKDRALSRLREQRELRDDLIAQLVARSAKVPVAAPAYVPSVRPRNPKTAGQLIMRMERALTPFVGLWLAAAPRPGDRSAAYAALVRADAVARSWGAGLLVWPGWNG